LTAIALAPERVKTRLDQWLWFARFAKSRSLAARLCTSGVVALNNATVKKPNQTLRVGDVVVIPQGSWQRRVRVLGLGLRRGPAAEARMLYEEIEAGPLRDTSPDWVPLLNVDDSADWPAEYPAPGPTLT
jgi:ribosome-associated heat shock protein Hsp15